jgi:hypothetical protein
MGLVHFFEARVIALSIQIHGVLVWLKLHLKINQFAEGKGIILQLLIVSQSFEKRFLLIQSAEIEALFKVSHT